ncbi:MAG: SH3 domain-containing protein [Bacillota bacterium]
MEFQSKRRLGVRALSLLLFLALLLGTVASALALTKNETAYSAVSLNVRSGPGTNYPVVGKLKVNDQVKYLDSSGKWAKIEFNGTVAYAYAKYLKSAGSPASEDGGKLYATASVNVRSGPGTSYSKLGALAKNQQVERLGSSGKWIKIAFGSGYAYVYGKYLTAAEPAIATGNASYSFGPAGNLSYEEQVLKLVNDQRTSRGLCALTLDATLSNLARAKSQDMHDNNYFSHTSPTYGSAFDMLKAAGISYRAAGENLAKGYLTPEAVVTGWMNSSGHRANILNGNYTRIGIGYVADGSYWTQIFIG